MVSSIGGGASVDGWYPTPGTGAAMSMVAASVPHLTELSSRAGQPQGGYIIWKPSKAHT